MRSMPAYSEYLVSDAKKHLASALDYAVNDCHVPADDFADLFVQSGIAGLFEEGNPAVVWGMSGPELARAVLSYAYGQSDFPEPTFAPSPTPEHWAGWALAWYQWETGRRFADIFRTVGLSEVVLMHRVYHEMDISHFCNELDRRIAGARPSSRLQAIRQQRGLSQSQLAKASGVNIRNIQLYEQGRNDIDKAQAQTLYKLARTLGCHIEDLLENPTV